MVDASIVIIIPCLNEELTIGSVIDDFADAVPQADIVVYDNGSTDRTADIARDHHARIVTVSERGKGLVLRQAFTELDYDIYVMVDGDATYPAGPCVQMIHDLCKHHADMIVGDRLSSTYFTENKRPLHGFGNRIVRWMINTIFHGSIKDVMSGYRVLSRRMVKSISIRHDGFEVETELTIYALQHHLMVMEQPVNYVDRPEGSTSKLHTIKDGFRVMRTIFQCWI
jgi:glycosyltransferase involved in cell wall biosynthesis